MNTGRQGIALSLHNKTTKKLKKIQSGCDSKSRPD